MSGSSFLNLTENPSIFNEFSLKILKDLLGFHAFHSLKESSSNQISIYFPPSLIIQAYHFREKQLFLKKLDFQLKFLEKLQDDDDIKFPLEIHDKV